MANPIKQVREQCYTQRAYNDAPFEMPAWEQAAIAALKSQGAGAQPAAQPPAVPPVSSSTTTSSTSSTSSTRSETTRFDMQAVGKEYSEIFGREINQVHARMIIALGREGLTTDQAIYALDEAAVAPMPSMRYALAVMRRMLADGEQRVISY